MAPTLTSNSFLLTTPPPHSLLRPSLNNVPRSLTVFAKKPGPSFPSFRLGKKPDDDESPADESEPAKTNPFNFKFDFSQVTDVKSLIPVVTKQSSGVINRRKDAGTVFVAGAAGQAGIRIAQTLLREGFSVRAGVPDLGAAQELARLAANYKIISTEESKRLNAVESTFQDAESIAKEIGNASKVVVTIGPSENGPTDQVTTFDALQVIQGAQLAGVSHVAIIYDGSPSVATNNVLDGLSSFFNNLFSKSQSLTLKEFIDSLVETDIRYTLIKTKLTDDLSPESSYNVVVSAEGSVNDTNDYKVGNSKIASLVATVFSNTAVAENKVVEVFTDPEAASRPISDLFSAIPEDGRRKAYAEATAKAKAEEEAIIARNKALEAADAAKKLEKEVKAEEAEEKAAVAGTSIESLLDRAKGLSSGISWEKLGSQFTNSAVEKLVEEEEPIEKETSSPGISWEKLSSQFASAVEKATEKPKVQIATVRGQAKARNLPAKKVVTKKPAAAAAKAKPKQTEQKVEARKIFGGLFQQETIYVDD